MGKIAKPNTGYCSVNSVAALSIGGVTFTTQNPPISYDSTGGDGATISDAGGVIGSVSMGAFLVDSPDQVTSPIQSTQYFPSKAGARVDWDGGSVTTENPPISYEIGLPAPCTEIFYSIEYTNPAFNFSSSRRVSPLITSATGVITTIANYVSGNCQRFDLVSAAYLQGNSGDTRPLVLSGNTTPEAYVPGCHSIQVSALRSCVTSKGYYQVFQTMDRYLVGALDTDDGGITSITIDSITPGGTGYTVRVSDASGIIEEVEQENAPTGFVVTGLDFDELGASYACQGECPAGTEFQCPCPETNTLYCYGFDPSNQNVFRSLFNSPITS